MIFSTVALKLLVSDEHDQAMDVTPTAKVGANYRWAYASRSKNAARQGKAKQAVLCMMLLQLFLGGRRGEGEEEKNWVAVFHLR